MLRERLSAGPVRALGAMSGTSLDGVDAAVIVTDGITITDFAESAYRPYGPEERGVLRAALGQWEGGSAAGDLVESAHAELLSGFEDVALIGFHGQTVAHEPRGRGTRQLGCGQVLADALGRPVVWDFRSADVEMGGEGAPLAPFFHHACARWMGARAPLGIVNLGGVGNITWIDPSIPAPELPGACLAFDTGPANAPLDDLMALRRGASRDEGGALAARGEVNDAVLERLLSGAFYRRMPPKSLDRDSFAWLAEAVSGLDDADAAATLAACMAGSVAAALEHCPVPPERLLITGGGRHNAAVMEMIRAAVDCPVDPVEEAGLDGDMLEAQAFAYLAVRVARGLPTSCPGTTGVAAAVGGGVVSHPSGR
ncbi:anhydro-N-acetylmuramic acid kinase [Profundibacterium mesophilum]|uniref:Anhydro-N-acetylmuramic acid kinase n=1 Tax=Profundibacterium mesophilum KAUST100406-0324 TaxID=1037889 RepID=A0A921TCX3_9RHOB|nr:anhydro-N-acetylmuramic acid kinase [Profundibacterium mesophilum]KAF0675661.1 Anhydro-N-acetylmuramic acid kinase [Profundibacterium mesophilum KAUST100406-0324]